MREKMRRLSTMVAVTMIITAIAMSQGQIQTLVVNGRSSVPVTQMNGRNYVEVEALARAANGTLSFNGNQVTLTLPPAGGNAAATAASGAAESPAANAGFSREFLRAGIEEMSTIREWHSALASAIENQYPVTQDGLAAYQARAMTNLGLVQAAAATEADQKAAQFIASEYQKMKRLSDKYVAHRANMTFIARDALENDALNQSLVACGKSLGAMAASGQFTDEVACH